MKRFVVSLIVGLAVGAGAGLFGAAWVGVPANGKPEPPANNPGTISLSQAPGGLVCYGSVDVEGGVLSLYPAVSGRIAEIPVHEGDVVKSGAVLLNIEDRIPRLQVQEAEAALKAAEAQLKTAQRGPQLHQYLLAQQKASLSALKHDLE